MDNRNLLKDVRACPLRGTVRNGYYTNEWRTVMHMGDACAATSAIPEHLRQRTPALNDLLKPRGPVGLLGSAACASRRGCTLGTGASAAVGSPAHGPSTRLTSDDLNDVV